MQGIVNKADLIAMIESIPGDTLEVFPESANYGRFDGEAVTVTTFKGLHAQGVFMRAAVSS